MAILPLPYRAMVEYIIVVHVYVTDLPEEPGPHI